MVLSEIRTYLKRHQRVNLKQLTTRFDMTPEAMRFLLKNWLHTGHLQQQNAQGCSTQKSSCGSCSGSQEETYVWQSDGQTIQFYPLNL